MPKRRGAVQSDSESEEERATPKRPRTVDLSDAEGATQTRRGRNARSQGRSRANAGDGSDAESEVVIPVAIDDDQFEQQNTDIIRAQLDKRMQSQRGIAEYGIIEAIEMHDFMCHKYLSFNFGPQINFIIGHNGSGKSAVLSALTIALGGKTNSTGRGSGLKSFIREGQSMAEVSIKIKNQGEEAFKHDQYGDSIIVTRRFTKEGNSTWKIQNAEGKTVSSKREELAAVCDHMNIQVDNPMNVLTQDAARQFLSASHPQDKYKFFLLGTQLFQLSTEYDICLENIRKTGKILAIKQDAIPDLKVRAREAVNRYKEAEKAREQKKRADDLKKELAWSHVAAKEKEMKEKIEEVAKMQRRLPKIQENLAKAEAAVEDQEGIIASLEAEVANLGNIDHLHEAKARLQQEIRTNRAKISEYNTDTRRMDDSLKATNRQISELTRQIDEEERKMAVHSQAKREELDRKVDAARSELEDAETRLKEILGQKQQLRDDCDAARNSCLEADKALEGIKMEISRCDTMTHQAQQHANDAYLPYGNNIKHVLDKIRSSSWHGDVPLGPLGMYVKAKDPKKWGEILRNQLMGHLMSFAITDPRDRPQLKQLLDQTRNRNTIIIFEKDMFDYSHGEPDPRYLTVLRALEVSDPYVLRILINQANIERFLLSNTRKQAEMDLIDLRGGMGFSADKFSVRVYPEGGVNSQPLTMRRQDGAAALLLTGRDTASEIQHYVQQKSNYETQYAELLNTKTQQNRAFAAAKQNLEKLSREREPAAHHRVGAAKLQLSTLQQEANDDLPTGIAGFKAAREEAEEEKKNIIAQFTEVETKKSELDRIQTDLQTQQNELKTRISEFSTRRNAFSTQIENAASERLQKQVGVKHYREKLEEEQKKIDNEQANADVFQEEFLNWTQKAEEFCERVERVRPVEQVQRDLTSVQNALKDREKRQGASVEEMALEVNKAKEAFEKAQREYKQMSALNKALKASLAVRLARWQEFRRHIALRTKVIFQYHLSQRGYFGKVMFNHDVQTLMLRVQTDDQIQTQGSAEKDPRALSGGEKSFSTICLLLSLWDSIGCPLRCLDEFDVFMDAVNRRISMKMMIDTANASPDKQYILITPQDMTSVHVGSNVRVLRMLDPERGNGRLRFGAGPSND